MGFYKSIFNILLFALILAVASEQSKAASFIVDEGKANAEIVIAGKLDDAFWKDPPEHSGYYQIAIDPDGHVNDLDRFGGELGKKGRYDSIWASGVEVVTSKGNDHWTLEAKVPVPRANQEDLNANFAGSGNKPTREVPWHINVCRNWRRDGKGEASALSPNEGEKGFHNIRTFARLTPKAKDK